MKSSDKSFINVYVYIHTSILNLEFPQKKDLNFDPKKYFNSAHFLPWRCSLSRGKLKKSLGKVLRLGSPPPVQRLLFKRQPWQL